MEGVFLSSAYFKLVYGRIFFGRSFCFLHVREEVGLLHDIEIDYKTGLTKELFFLHFLYWFTGGFFLCVFV